eukprot:TRINITY_DN1606_c0_g1_i6.p1 TRINITY_DN1606_c0_g1~~TRINITY_DN1606_c0_g1_i6.p1  ORF type:complete len:129 (-),score=72.15 TRINITY_DN1606_c0_g1_i6:406-792(-)
MSVLIRNSMKLSKVNNMKFVFSRKIGFYQPFLLANDATKFAPIDKNKVSTASKEFSLIAKAAIKELEIGCKNRNNVQSALAAATNAFDFIQQFETQNGPLNADNFEQLNFEQIQQLKTKKEVLELLTQ